MTDEKLPKAPDDKRLANLKRGHNRKGVPNKVTKALKDMILGALDGAGGQEYLQRQADANPVAFLTLLGKVLPAEIKGQVEGAIQVKIVSEFND